MTSIDSRVSIGINIRDGSFKDRFTVSLNRFDYLDISEISDLTQNLNLVVTDNLDFIEHGPFQDLLPLIFINLGDRGIDSDTLVQEKNVFRIISLPSKNDFNSVIEIPAKEELPKTLADIIWETAEVSDYLRANRWVKEEEWWKPYWVGRREDEISLTANGNYPERNFRETVTKIRGPPRKISKTEALFQALKIEYLFEKGQKPKFPEEEVVPGTRDRKSGAVAISRTHAGILSTLRENPEIYFKNVISLVRKARNIFPPGSTDLPLFETAQSYMLDAEKILEDVLKSMSESIWLYRLKTYETKATNDLYIVLQSDTANQLKKEDIFCIKKIQRISGTSVPHAVYRSLDQNEKGREKSRSRNFKTDVKSQGIIFKGKNLAGVELGSRNIDNEINGHDVSFRQFLYYWYLPKISTPKMHPPIESNLSFKNYLIMDFIGGMPTKEKIRLTDEDSFNFFNMLPKISEIGGDFAEKFKLLMEFEKNKTVSYMQRLPLTGIETKKRKYSEELAHYTICLFEHISGSGSLSQEEKENVRFYCSALESGLKGSQWVFSRDASKKNYLFAPYDTSVQTDIDSLVSTIFSKYNAVKKKGGTEGNALKKIIRNKKLEIDMEKMFILTHPFEPQRHDMYGRGMLHPDMQEISDYHFLVQQVRSEILKKFLEKENPDPQDLIQKMNEIKQLVKEIENSKNSLEISQKTEEFLSANLMEGYEKVSDYFHDLDWMGVYRPARSSYQFISRDASSEPQSVKEILSFYVSTVRRSLHNLTQSHSGKKQTNLPQTEKQLLREKEDLESELIQQSLQKYLFSDQNQLRKITGLRNIYDLLYKKLEEE